MKAVFFLKLPSLTGLACAGLAACLLTGAAPAQDDERHWTVGLGVVAQSNPYLGADDEIEFSAIPYIAYENDRFSVSPEGLAVTVYRLQYLRFELLAAPRWQFAEPGDADGLADLDRDIAVDAGFRVAAANGPVTISLDYLTDVSGTHKGQEVTLSLEAGTDLTPRLSVSAQAGGSWRDSDLGTYLYGVFPDEVRAGRPAWEVGDTVAPFVAAMGQYALTERMALVGGVELEAIPEDGRDSPIIDSDAQYGVFMALTMRF